MLTDFQKYIILVRSDVPDEGMAEFYNVPVQEIKEFRDYASECKEINEENSTKEV